MPKAGAINGDNAIALRKLVEQPAYDEVLGHRSVTVEQDHGSAFAARDVVDSKSVDLDEPAWGAAGPLGLDGPQRLCGLPGNLFTLPDGSSGRLDRRFQQFCKRRRDAPSRDTEQGSPVHTHDHGDLSTFLPTKRILSHPF